MDKFQPMPKIPRLNRDMIITEKLDGTNASVWIVPISDNGFGYEGEYDTPLNALAMISIGNQMYAIYAGSRNRFLSRDKDNFGFAKWVHENAEDLAMELGEGTHYGEWWGKGIQRGYGLDKKRFSLFNVSRWGMADLSRCNVVPTIYSGPFDTEVINTTLRNSRGESAAAPGYTNPEGLVIFHTASRHVFKVTYEMDMDGKGDNR